MDAMKRRANILEREVGREHMLYDVTGRKVHVLNETAHFVWQRCDGNHDVTAIAKLASEAFAVAPEQARKDIDACLAELRALALLE